VAIEAELSQAAPAGVDFAAPGWLSNPHLQSVVPSLPFLRPFVERRARPLIDAARPVLIDCGEGVRLLGLHTSRESLGLGPARRMAVLLHGWEGSSNAMYVLGLGQYLLGRGFDVIRLNLRDHGDSHALNREIFHSCRIDEVVGAVRRLQELHPDRGLNLVGFSLGGNFFLRVGARARAAGIDVERIVAICPVIDPRHTLAVLEQGFPLYRAYFVQKWRRSLRKKQQAWPDYDFSEVYPLGTLTGMTDHLVTRYGGFPDLDTYLRGYAVTGEALAPLSVPTRIISSADDPIIPVEDLDRLARPPGLTITQTRHGGHCGFYAGRGGAKWLAQEIARTLGPA
jgi:predicted alpha/beta-fold hydrolase